MGKCNEIQRSFKMTMMACMKVAIFHVARSIDSEEKSALACDILFTIGYDCYY